MTSRTQAVVLKRPISFSLRTIILGGLLAIIFSTSVFAATAARDGFRDFSSADGRNIRGRILKYDAKRKKLFFERDTKKQMWITPVAFSEKDQTYIQEWIIADLFLSKSAFKISIEKRAGERKEIKGKGTFVKKEVSQIYYKIIINNITDISIRDIAFKYNCYIKREGYNGVSDSDYWIFDTIHNKNIASHEQSVSTTSPINLETVYHQKTEISHSIVSGTLTTDILVKKQEDRIGGIWFKIYDPKLDGVPVVRDICFPRDFSKKHEWSLRKSLAPPLILSPTKPKKTDSMVTRMLFRKIGKEAANKTNEKREEAIKMMISSYNADYDKEYYGSLSSWIGSLYYKNRNFKSALMWYEKSLQSGNKHIYIILIKLYASGSPEICDGSKAVEYALIAMKGHENDISTLEVLASAYARNGQFNMAIKTQKQAIAIWQKQIRYKQKPTLLRKRLELYQNGQPFSM